MPIAHRPESEIKKVNATNQLSLDAIETINNVSKKPESIVENTEEISHNMSSDDTKKYSDTVIARLTKGKRSEFKSFFAKYGITMNSGIEMCIEYVINQVEQENAKISKAGVMNNTKVN